MTLDINQLLNDVRNGNNDAMDLLIQNYWRVGKKIIRKYNLENSDVLYEEDDYSFVIYSSLIKSINKYTESLNCNIEAFIVRRLKQDIMKKFNNERCKKQLVFSRCENETINEPSYGSNPEHYARIEEIRNIVSNLNDIDQKICQLLMSGYTINKISNLLKIPYTSCVNKIAFIREKFYILI